MTKIITIGGEKGGPGKSTLITNLAAYAVNKGLKLVLIDSDKQRSTARWVTERNKDEKLKKIFCIEKPDSDLTNVIREYAQQKGEDGKSLFDLAMIDTPGVDSEQFGCAAIISHVIAIPTKTSSFDVWTIPTTYNTVNKIFSIRDLNPPRAIVIPSMITTHAIRGPRQLEKIAKFVAKLPKFELSKNIISQREDFVDAPAFGQSVNEFAPGSAAAREIEKLFEEVVNV